MLSHRPQQQIGMIILIAFAFITIARAQSGYALFSYPNQKQWQYLYYAEKLNEKVENANLDVTQAEIARSYYFDQASKSLQHSTRLLQENTLAILLIAMVLLVVRFFVFSKQDKSPSPVRTQIAHCLNYFSAFFVSWVWLATILRLRTSAQASIQAGQLLVANRSDYLEQLSTSIHIQQFRWTIFLTLSCGLLLCMVAYLQYLSNKHARSVVRS